VKNRTHRLFAALLLLAALGTLTSAFAQITPSQDSYSSPTGCHESMGFMR